MGFWGFGSISVESSPRLCSVGDIQAPCVDNLGICDLGTVDIDLSSFQGTCYTAFKLVFERFGMDWLVAEQRDCHQVDAIVVDTSHSVFLKDEALVLLFVVYHAGLLVQALGCWGSSDRLAGLFKFVGVGSTESFQVRTRLFILPQQARPCF